MAEETGVRFFGCEVEGVEILPRSSAAVTAGRAAAEYTYRGGPCPRCGAEVWERGGRAYDAGWAGDTLTFTRHECREGGG